jgi:nitroimidazol reductase NimA-like FMN-containing flavoprotein (pyridoxamine 5'-phosphate oxidase superfamily)
MPQLTENEILTLLQGPIIARLATVTERGTPYMAPVWQTWDEGAMYIIPRAGARFVAHIEANPAVAVSCADDVNPDHRRILIEGQAEIVDGPALMSGDTLAIATEMATRYGGQDGLEYLNASLHKPRYRIRIVPSTITSWRGAWHPRYE